MIHFRAFAREESCLVQVVGNGPRSEEPDPNYPVIACNDAASSLEVAPLVHLSMDRPYWQTKTKRDGSISVWVQPHGEPWPRFRTDAFVYRAGDNWGTEFDGWDIPCGGGCGPAACALAATYYRPAVILLYGFTRDGKYEKINRSISTILREVPHEYV